MDITKSPIINNRWINKSLVMRQFLAITINFQLSIPINYHKIKKSSKKVSLKLLKISKLERFSLKSPSQLGFAGEHLLWGTARGILFFNDRGVRVCRFLRCQVILLLPLNVEQIISQMYSLKINGALLSIWNYVNTFKLPCSRI